MAPVSALPIGATRVVSEMQPLQVDPAQMGSGLYNAVLALLSDPNPDESERYDEEMLDLHVIGFLVMYVPFSQPLRGSRANMFMFVCSTSIDIPNKRMTILAPSQGSLTGRTAIVGSFEWQE